MTLKREEKTQPLFSYPLECLLNRNYYCVKNDNFLRSLGKSFSCFPLLRQCFYQSDVAL